MTIEGELHIEVDSGSKELYVEWLDLKEKGKLTIKATSSTGKFTLLLTRTREHKLLGTVNINGLTTT